MSRPEAAAIFDMDGTLVDNMGVHLEAWVEFAAAHGVQITAERFQRELAGKTNADTLPALLGRPFAPAEAERLAEEKERVYRERIRPRLALHRGAAELLAELARHGVPAAVATSAPPANRDLVLDGLDIRRCFAHVIGAEHAPRGKPAPDIFLAAAAALGVPPACCVVFEDACLGVQAGRAAGMTVVGITTCAPAEDLRAAGAHHVVPDFVDLPSELRARLFA